MKRILILEEHHGTWYLDASTRALLEAAALSAVRGRFGCDNIYYPIDVPSKPAPPFTEEELKHIPAVMQKDADRKIKEYERELQGYKLRMKELRLIDRCLRTNDGALAVRVLELRQGSSDECFRLEELLAEYKKQYQGKGILGKKLPEED
jgi:hypothetical protein